MFYLRPEGLEESLSVLFTPFPGEEQLVRTDILTDTAEDGRGLNLSLFFKIMSHFWPFGLFGQFFSALLSAERSCLDSVTSEHGRGEPSRGLTSSHSGTVEFIVSQPRSSKDVDLLKYDALIFESPACNSWFDLLFLYG